MRGRGATTDCIDFTDLRGEANVSDPSANRCHLYNLWFKNFWSSRHFNVGQQRRLGKTPNGCQHSHRDPSFPQPPNNRETLQHLRLRLPSAWETPHRRSRRFCDRATAGHGLAGVYDFLLFGFAFCKRKPQSKRCGIGGQGDDCTHWHGLDSGWRIHYGHR